MKPLCIVFVILVGTSTLYSQYSDKKNNKPKDIPSREIEIEDIPQERVSYYAVKIQNLSNETSDIKEIVNDNILLKKTMANYLQEEQKCNFAKNLLLEINTSNKSLQHFVNAKDKTVYETKITKSTLNDIQFQKNLSKIQHSFSTLPEIKVKKLTYTSIRIEVPPLSTNGNKLGVQEEKFAEKFAELLNKNPNLQASITLPSYASSERKQKLDTVEKLLSLLAKQMKNRRQINEIIQDIETTNTTVSNKNIEITLF